MNNNQLYAKALLKWGKWPQVNMAIEEMSELTKELCKNLRGRHNKEQIAEEIADVEIMLGQMKLLYQCQDEVDSYKHSKLTRLEVMVR